MDRVLVGKSWLHISYHDLTFNQPFLTCPLKTSCCGSWHLWKVGWKLQIKHISQRLGQRIMEIGSQNPFTHPGVAVQRLKWTNPNIIICNFSNIIGFCGTSLEYFIVDKKVEPFRKIFFWLFPKCVTLNRNVIFFVNETWMSPRHSSTVVHRITEYAEVEVITESKSWPCAGPPQGSYHVLESMVQMLRELW